MKKLMNTNIAWSLFSFISGAAGIGTAAGVAWPLFGTVSGSLGFGIGTTASIILGGATGGVFLLVLLPVSIWSFKNFINDKKASEQKYQEEIAKFNDYVVSYLLTIIKGYLLKHSLTCIDDIKDIDDVIRYSINKINKFQQKDKLSQPAQSFLDAIANNKSYLEQFIYTLKNKFPEIKTNNLPALLKDQPSFNHDISSLIQQNEEKKEQLSKQIKKSCNAFYDNVEKEISKKPIPITPYVMTGIVGFFSGFGTILGCSAGVSGLLVGVGLFAGLTAIPIVGWATLGAAIIFGGIIAASCAYHAYKKAKFDQSIQHIEAINHTFDMEQQLLNEHIETKAKMKKKIESSMEKKNQEPCNDVTISQTKHPPTPSPTKSRKETDRASVYSPHLSIYRHSRDDKNETDEKQPLLPKKPPSDQQKQRIFG